MGRCGKPGFWMQEPDAAWGYTHGHGGEEPSPISTGPDFGCIHHPDHAKDATNDK